MQKIQDIMTTNRCDVAGAICVLFREEPDLAVHALHRLLSDLYMRLHSLEQHCVSLRETNDTLNDHIDSLRKEN